LVQVGEAGGAGAEIKGQKAAGRGKIADCGFNKKAVSRQDTTRRKKTEGTW